MGQLKKILDYPEAVPAFSPALFLSMACFVLVYSLDIPNLKADIC